MREKIELNDTTSNIIIKMSEGNPGAITVLMQLLEKNAMEGFRHILDLDDMNIRGTQIWIGYKDYCKNSIENFKKCVSNRDREMVNIINEQGRLGNHDEIAVCRG